VVGLWKSEEELLKNLPLLTESDLNSDDLASETVNGHSKYTIESLLNWIEAWLAKRLKIDPDQIDASKSFADYGLDSVMAVEFSQALGDWLKYPLEATILWNFSTIESLAQHLTTELKKTSSDVQPKSPPEPEISSQLNHASPSEIESLINQEISALEKLLERGQ
jgi:acyl carrier protein